MGPPGLRPQTLAELLTKLPRSFSVHSNSSKLSLLDIQQQASLLAMLLPHSTRGHNLCQLSTTTTTSSGSSSSSSSSITYEKSNQTAFVRSWGCRIDASGLVG